MRSGDPVGPPLAELAAGKAAAANVANEFYGAGQYVDCLPIAAYGQPAMSIA